MDIEELLRAYAAGQRDFREETITANEAIYHRDLQDINLAGANLKGLTFVGCDFSGANLEGAILSEITLRGVKLCRANLVKTKFLAAQLSDVDLTDALYDPRETQFPRQFDPQAYGARAVIQEQPDDSQESLGDYLPDEKSAVETLDELPRIASVEVLLEKYNSSSAADWQELKSLGIPVAESLTTKTLGTSAIEIIFLENYRHPSYWIISDEEGYFWLAPIQKTQLDYRLFACIPPQHKGQRHLQVLAPPRVSPADDHWVLVEPGVIVDDAPKSEPIPEPTQTISGAKLFTVGLLATVLSLGVVAIAWYSLRPPIADVTDENSGSTTVSEQPPSAPQPTPPPPPPPPPAPPPRPQLSWQPSCGSDYAPSSYWWPVRGPSSALSIVQDRYCGDALIIGGQTQAASFRSKEAAEEFADLLTRASGYSFYVGDAKWVD